MTLICVITDDIEDNCEDDDDDECKLPKYRGYFSPYFIHGYIT